MSNKIGLKKDYSGIITIDLDIPLKDDGVSPDFDNPRIVFNTYNKNVKKVRFEDLRSHSQNLLDNDPIDILSLFGEDAVENGYPYPSLRSFLFQNDKGEMVSQLQRNKNYIIKPLVSLPTLSEENGYEEYVGYAYKWEIIIHNNATSTDEIPAIRTIPWTYVIDSDGTVPEINSAYLPLEGSQEELLELWNNKDMMRRTQLVSGFPSVNENIYKGDLHRTVKTGSDFINIKIREGYLDFYMESQYPTSSHYEDIPIPDTFLAQNKFPVIEPIETFDIKVPEDETFQKWKERDIDISGYKKGAYINLLFKSNKIAAGRYKREFQKNFVSFPTSFDYFEFTELTTGLFELDTRNRLFNNSTSGIQVRLWIAPTKTKDSFTEDEIKEMNLDAQIVTSAYMPFQNTEELLPPLINTSRIRESRYMTFFEDMLVLYGGEVDGNIIYLSDFSNVSYFPFKYALDQIPNEIVHIHPFQNIMVVFTRSDIWTIEKIETENEFGVVTTDFIAKQVLQNVYIDEHLKNTIKTVGKYIMIMLEDKVIFLKPNSFTGDVTDLSYMEVSTPIGNILKDPQKYVENRLKYYNIFNESNLQFELYADVDNKDFKIILSTFIESVKKPYMIELIFNGTTGVWTIYDTMSTAYPFNKSNNLTYMKSHPKLGGGITLTNNDGSFKYKIMENDKVHMDIDQYIYYDNDITLNLKEHLKKPINTIINLGNMNISNHLNKRFHEIQYEMTNINSDGIDMAYEFKVDGRTQQTSDRVIMEINNFILEEKQQIEFEALEKKRQIEFETLDELSNMGFDNFLLDLSRFPISERITTRVSANGRGRIGSFRMSFNITNDFEIFRFLIIYKEQTSRKVSQ